MFEPKKICTQCGHYGRVTMKNRGSVILLLFLFLCFVVPGVLYLLYMLTGHTEHCRQCGQTTLIKPDSPAGRELMARYYPQGVPGYP